MNRRKKPRYKLIINMPDLVARHKKIGSSIFTIIFWGLFAYLWMPLITLVAWSLGLRRSYDEVLYMAELNNFMHLAFVYSMIVLAMGGALLLWALQEYLRFRNVNRRREPIEVEMHELATYTGIDESDIATSQLARRVLAHHAKDGKVIRLA